MLALLATAFITFALGFGFLQWLDIDIMSNGHMVEPLQAIIVSTVIVLAIVLVAAAIILSVFGSVLFVLLMIIGSLAMAFVGMFWPILIAVIAIWLVLRDKPETNTTGYRTGKMRS
jgi:hypothetical protein